MGKTERLTMYLVYLQEPNLEARRNAFLMLFHCSIDRAAVRRCTLTSSQFLTLSSGLS